MGLWGRAVKESTSIQLVNKLIVLSTIRRFNIAFTTLSALNPPKLRRYCPLLHTALQLFPALMKDGTIICVDTHTHTYTPRWILKEGAFQKHVPPGVMKTLERGREYLRLSEGARSRFFFAFLQLLAECPG